MKEEIEEEFYRGLTREFKKGNDDCIAKQRLLYPNRERERERDGRNSLFHSFLPSDSLYTSTKKRRERRKERRKKEREREKLGKIIGLRLFVRLFVVYVEEGTEREREGKSLFHCFQSFLFVVYIEDTTREKLVPAFSSACSSYTSKKEPRERERNWGKSLFYCFQSFPFIV